MRKIFIIVGYLVICSVAMLKSQSNPVIIGVSVEDTVVKKYDKLEVLIEIEANFQNPFDYKEISVAAELSAPDGTITNVDGFFMENYALDSLTGRLQLLGEGQFAVRFAPHQLGLWKFTLTVLDKMGSIRSEEYEFQCIPSVKKSNKGFARTGMTNYLQFENEEPLILIGENMAWQNDNAYLNYRKWLGDLIEHRGNFIRLWHAHWGLGIEWKKGWRNFNGLQQYQQENCFLQDWLFDYCAEHGVYVMLALQHHGQVSTMVNPNWTDNPYYVQNGGPCQNTWDFFSNESAKRTTKNRLRYIVARWGYSRSVLAWELFNEVNWTDNYTDHQESIQAWQSEMAAYLKEIDPYQHIVTTSFALENLDPVTWMDPNIDITQTHHYLNTGNIERLVARGVQNYLNQFGKPVLNGEFGLGPYPELSNEDSDGIHLHNGLWGGLFAGGLGTAMSWWWDLYVAPQNLYYHFAGISKTVEEIPFVEANLQPVFAQVLGEPGDLNLVPNLGWGEKGSEQIIILGNGTTKPSNPGLGQFLYGSQFNTQFRSPPTFSVNYPVPGTFTVTTSSELQTNPRVSIYVDGALILDEQAMVNQNYTIEVPSGRHQIKVDNLGTDWVSIANYRFGGLGSNIDAYVLGSEEGIAAGWVFNHAYNHQNIMENGIPRSLTNGQLLIEGLPAATYEVNWYDCLTGNFMTSQTISLDGTETGIPIPELYWDLAFVLSPAAISVATKDSRKELEVAVWPNPIRAGDHLQITVNDEIEPLHIRWFDAQGKIVDHSGSDQLLNGQQKVPVALVPGVYWLNIMQLDRTKSIPILVQ